MSRIVRKYRRVELPAADTAEAKRHVCAQRPISALEAHQIREATRG
jgi:hypothetical protein